jgi:multiple sugar transport system permease protein
MQTRSMQPSARRNVDLAIIVVLIVMGVLMLMPFLWLFSMSFPAGGRRLQDATELPAADARPHQLLDGAQLNRAVPHDLLEQLVRGPCW